MILQFGPLGFFEGEELVKGKVVAVVVGAAVDGDTTGDGIVGDARHGCLTNGTDDGRRGGGGVFG